MLRLTFKNGNKNAKGMCLVRIESVHFMGTDGHERNSACDKSNPNSIMHTNISVLREYQEFCAGCAAEKMRMHFAL